MKRRKHLTPEDRQLWDLVRETATPLRAEPPPEPAAPPAPPAKAAKPARPKAAAPPLPAYVPPSPVAPVAPAKLDRRTRSRLSRGILDVDARIDLHGMTQAMAHQRLRRFLEEEQANGARLVLVITGKGSPVTEHGAPERGVLRRSVPAWLDSADLRQVVAGFDEAGRRHGGEGAIYVRIRRKRGAHHE